MSDSRQPSPSRLSRFLREPLLHFALLGGLIFAVAAWRDQGSTEENELPRIDITAGTITWLREGFYRQWHREPDASELRGLVKDHLREEVLYREGLALGLDRDDTIVRRRMAQKVEFLTQDIAATATPDDAALQKFFAENATRYAEPARVSFQHLYFSKDRRGQRVDADAREALAALNTGTNAETLGDPFLGELEFKDASVEEISAGLGGEFSGRVSALPLGEWQGPVASSYGLHLVRVSERADPQPVAFEAARDVVVRDFADERRLTTNEDFLKRLETRYRITVDEAALTDAAAPPIKTATK